MLGWLFVLHAIALVGLASSKGLVATVPGAILVVVSGVMTLAFFGLWSWSDKDPLAAAMTGLVVYGTLATVDLVTILTGGGDGTLVRVPIVILLRAPVIGVLIWAVVNATRIRNATTLPHGSAAALHAAPVPSGPEALGRIFTEERFPLVMGVLLVFQGIRVFAAYWSSDPAGWLSSAFETLVLVASVVVVYLGLSRGDESETSHFLARALLVLGLLWAITLVVRLWHLWMSTPTTRSFALRLVTSALPGLLADLLIVGGYFGWSEFWGRARTSQHQELDRLGTTLDEARRLAGSDPETSRALLGTVLASDPTSREALQLMWEGLRDAGRAAEGVPYVVTLIQEDVRTSRAADAYRHAKALHVATGRHAPPELRWRIALGLAFSQPSAALDLLDQLAADPGAGEYAEYARARAARIRPPARSG